MKFSEFKLHFKNSKFAETMVDTKRFFKGHKFFVYVFITVIIFFSIFISPLISRYIYTPETVVTTESSKDNKFTQNIKIYISGEVNNPGVYSFTNDERVEDAIKAAGGLKDDAFIEYVNLAQRLYDEQYINIPSVKDEEKDKKKSSEVKVFDGVVNINTATVKEFQQLPGVGETVAARIVEYRNNVGRFEDIRDIMSVDGMGEALFNNIRYNLTL